MKSSLFDADGQVLVAGSWNYPLLLSLEPVAAAYAAGNQVVLKLPLRAHKTSLFIRWLIEETFVGDEVITVEKEANLPDLLELNNSRTSISTKSNNSSSSTKSHLFKNTINFGTPT